LGLDAPKVREIILSQMPPLVPSPTPTAIPTAAPTSQLSQPPQQPTPTVPVGPVTFEKIGPIFEAKCNACHGETGIKGLSLTSYAKVMAGGTDGPVISAGMPDDSSLVKVQLTGKHPGQLSPEELDLVKQWISGGAIEK
jgi:mono/diheme cytochrome c family protein